MEDALAIKQNQRVLLAGLVCVDLFQVMPKYPEEDLGHRCLDSYFQRGGNASNSATVLSLLGGDVEFFGTLSNDRELDFIEQDFKKFGINYKNCVVMPDTSCPMSVVIISQESKTRTVLHTNKNLPELSLHNFQHKIDLDSGAYGWVHFEGRDNAAQIAEMMAYIHEYNKSKEATGSSYKPIIVSLEAEKLRFAAGMEKYNLWKLADVLFVSKDFARHQGYMTMKDSVYGFSSKLKQGAVIICAWGEEGAAALSSETGFVISPAFPPSCVIDTCGAGDTFNAATIYALSHGKGLHAAISFGCKIAGAKCGMLGFKVLSEIKERYL